VTLTVPAGAKAQRTHRALVGATRAVVTETGGFNADAVAERAGELATLEARNAGKPIGDARGEMEMVVQTFRYYAAAPERLVGRTIPVAGGVDMTFHEPLGVVGLIVPWNFPLVIASWTVAPAQAAGNSVVREAA
jgi:acyl-CoA reductase-like NAD-dependent aldehyde dehydrogenase